MNIIFSRKNVSLVVLIIVVAFSLSALSYQQSSHISQQIEQMSTDDIRSNADIQTNDLANLVSSEISHVQSVLQTLSKSPLIQGSDFEKAKETLNQAENSSGRIIDFYMWLDKDGKLVWVSNMNQTAYQHYKDFDLSYRLYFIHPRDTHEVYYSSVVDSNDHINRLYISYPIILKEAAMAPASPSSTSDPANVNNRSNSSGNDNATQGRFEGIIVAGIRTDIFGKLLEEQISPNLQSQVGMLDNSGIILYSNHAEYMGKNVFGYKFQSFLAGFDAETGSAMNEGFKAALAGNSGSRDITIGDDGNKATFVYKPIILDGKQFGALFLIASHEKVFDTAALVNTQKNLSIGIIGVIGASALGIIFAILLWNKRLEETVSVRTGELKTANEQLKAHDKMQTEFVNIAAHELRTPIQPIVGMIDILKYRLDGNANNDNNSNGKSTVEVTGEQLALMDRNAKRLQKLSSEILDATRIESGTLKLDKEVIDINEKIESVIADAKSWIPPSQGMDVQFKPLSDESRNPIPLLVKADTLRMFEVISNLVRNAIKFSAEGGVITITTDRGDDRYAIVSVKDQGAGISAEMLPRLFTKFSTDRERGGTGLGLFIAKNIVEAHGGRIWAKNNSNDDGDKGATFAFTLPMHKP